MNNQWSDAACAIRITGDVVVSVPDSIRLMTTYILREQEDWFESEIGFLRAHLQGKRVLDVGANYGLYALSLANEAGLKGRVWAVEPCLSTAAHLRRSIDLNGFKNIEVIQSALSNRSGTAQLRISANSELNTLVGGITPGEDVEEVAVTTLDRLVMEHGINDVDFLKIDAEGEEERIIEGGLEFLRSESPLVMYEFKQGGHTNHGLIRHFGTIAYESYRLIPGLGMLVPFDDGRSLDASQLNLFCCKADRADSLVRQGYLVADVGTEFPETALENWWRDELVQWPFARKLREDWVFPTRRGSGGSSGYKAVLELYGAAHDGDNHANQRYAALRSAFELSVALCENTTNIFHLSTYARIGSEMGEREWATRTLVKAIKLLMQEKPGSAGEPFLPASRHFDRVDPDVRLEEWLAASLMDQYVCLSGHSTYFAQPAMLQALEMLKAKAHAFRRPEMERRRQLMRMKAGLQLGPVPDPLLAEYRSDNLNPDFWAAPRPACGERE